MSRPPAKKLPRAVFAMMLAGAAVFAATAAFVLGPWLLPRKPGEFSIAQMMLTTGAGMFGALVGAGLGNRLAVRKK
jgi:hypothetical protein